MLRDTRERAEPICAALMHGCSISVPLQTTKGYTVGVWPVADASNGQCSYASDTQIYYEYDQHRKFIDARGRFIRTKVVTP